VDIGAALTIALLAALLGQVWAAQVRLERQLHWLSAALLLNAMTLPAAMLLFGDSNTVFGMAAGFAAILVASASGMGALIWLYRIEKLSQTNAVSALEVTPANAPSAATNAAKTHG
jgi:hypothetical protein